MANPRKFSDKLEIIKRKEQEANEAFIKIMREVTDARKGPGRRYIQQKFTGGSLPNVNNFNVNSSQIATQNVYGNSMGDFYAQQQQTAHNYRFANAHSRRNLDPTSGPIFPTRNKGRSSTVMTPYTFSHQQAIIPEQNDSPSWRRTFSDSAIQQTLQQPPKKHSDDLRNSTSRGIPATTPEAQDIPNFSSSPPMSINYTDNPPQNKHHVEMQANTSSLPDLSNLSIPSPIQNPIDVEQENKNNSSNSHDLSNPFQVPFRIPPPRRSTGKQVYPRQITSNPDVLETLQREKLHMNSYPVLNMEKSELTLPGNSSSAPLSPVTPPPYYWNSTPMSPLATGDIMHQAPTDLQQQLQQFQIHNESRGNNGMTHPPPYPYPTDNENYSNYFSNSTSYSPKQNVYRINSGPAQLTSSSSNSKAFCDRQLESALMRVKAHNNELSEADLNSVRVALDPLDFDAVQMLSGDNTELVDQSAEEQFRMER